MELFSSFGDAIQSIANIFVSLYEFVLGIFEDTIYLIKITAAFVAQIPSYFSWLPPQALALIVSIFAVVVIYKVLGREG